MLALQRMCTSWNDFMHDAQGLHLQSSTTAVKGLTLLSCLCKLASRGCLGPPFKTQPRLQSACITCSIGFKNPETPSVLTAFPALTGDGGSDQGDWSKGTGQGIGSAEPSMATAALQSSAVPNCLAEALRAYAKSEIVSNSGSEVSSMSPDALASMLPRRSKPDSPSLLQTWLGAQQALSCPKLRTADAGKPPALLLMPAGHVLYAIHVPKLEKFLCVTQVAEYCACHPNVHSSSEEPDPTELLVQAGWRGAASAHPSCHSPALPCMHCLQHLLRAP